MQYAILVLFLLISGYTQAGEKWFGGDSLYGARSGQLVGGEANSAIATPEHRKLVSDLFARVDLESIQYSTDQPDLSILSSGHKNEIKRGLFDLTIIDQNNTPFTVPVRELVWSRAIDNADHPDSSLYSGVTWGSSGGGAGLVCALSNQKKRRLVLRERLVKPLDGLRNQWMLASPPSFERLRPFLFDQEDKLVSGTLETFESLVRSERGEDIKSKFAGQSERAIYQQLSHWIAAHAPAFYLRWQMTKAKMQWVPVHHIDLIPDSLFSRHYSVRPYRNHGQGANKSIDEYIRIKTKSGKEYDCRKHQVMVNHFAATERGRVPRATIYYNQRLYETFPPVDRVVARLHEEWYVMASLQGHVTSEQVRKTILTVISSHFRDLERKADSWLFHEDTAQGALQDLVFPVKVLYSQDILDHQPGVKSEPYLYTQWSVEMTLRLHNAVRSVMASFEDRFSPTYQWDRRKTLLQNAEAMDRWWVQREHIQQMIKAQVINDPKFLKTLNSDAKAMIFLLDHYHSTGESLFNGRFENEGVLNSPPEQKAWSVQQNFLFSTFCERIQDNKAFRENFDALSQATYDSLRTKALRWCARR